MAEGAHIASIEAIAAFRAQLVVYLSRVRPALDSAGEEVRRTRAWLQSDRLPHWQLEIKRRERMLERAEQELFQVRLSNVKVDHSLQMMAVHKAKRAVEEGQSKLRLTKKWLRDFDSVVEPLAARVDRVRDLFANVLPKGVLSLGEVQRSMQAYLDVRAGGTGPGSSSGSSAEPAESGTPDPVTPAPHPPSP